MGSIDILHLDEAVLHDVNIVLDGLDLLALVGPVVQVLQALVRTGNVFQHVGDGLGDQHTFQGVRPA